MNKIIKYFFPMLVLSIIGIVSLKSQIPGLENGNVSYMNVDELCYITNTVEKIRVANDVNIETLTNMEKVKFTSTEYRKNHHLFFENNNYVHQIKYLYQDNKFPKWYKVADLITIDNEGIKSYYFEYSSYYTDGWPGSGKDTMQFGIYGNDPRTGKRYYHENHSVTSQNAYNSKNYYFNEYGFLYGKVYYVPNSRYFQQLINMGYTVTSTPNSVIISNSDITISWDLNKKTIKKEIYEGGVLIYTIITKYVYYPEFGEDLRSEITEITPQNFENGDCYEDVVITEFTDYSFGCDDEIEFHSTDSHISNFNFVIDPNPVKDELNVRFTNSNSKKVVEIISIKGDILATYNIDMKNTSTKINVSNLESGLYILRVDSEGKTVSEKFIKL
ncbi:MAG: T9SS type A sorting domain-containing protein [Saprospiraceae bacterium]